MLKVETDQIQGSLARIGPNELVTSDPEVLQKIMSGRSAYTRGFCNFSTPLVLAQACRVRRVETGGWEGQLVLYARRSSSHQVTK